MTGWWVLLGYLAFGFTLGVLTIRREWKRIHPRGTFTNSQIIAHSAAFTFLWPGLLFVIVIAALVFGLSLLGSRVLGPILRLLFTPAVVRKDLKRKVHT